MSAANEALSITFSEDDLRPSRVSQRSEKIPEKIERRDKIPRTPPRRGTSVALPAKKQSLDERIPASLERRAMERKVRSADEGEKRLREDFDRKMRLLGEREREEDARLERMQKEEEKLKRLREQLEKEEAQRHQQLLEQRSGSGLHSPEDLSTPPEIPRVRRPVVRPSLPPSPQPTRRRSLQNSRYNRFSDLKYYNWSSDEEEHRRPRSRSRGVDHDDHQHDHSDGPGCELCDLGKKFETAQRQKKKKRLGYIDENCKIVEEFAKKTS